MNRAVVLVLSPGGLDVARRIAKLLEAEIHGPAARMNNVDATFIDFAAHVRALFADGRPLIGVCAAGALIRALAPALSDKRNEPPVLVVSEDGAVAVPLLGGHHGANALAERLAGELGGWAAVTTAGDRRFGVAFDDPPEGWSLDDPKQAKPFVAALLAGGTMRIEGNPPLSPDRLPLSPDAERVAVSNSLSSDVSTPERLVYRPRSLALGVGCERGCDPAVLIAHVRETLAKADLAEAAVAGVFSIDVKADEPAVHELAKTLGVPARFLSAERLEAETPRLASPSDLVFREVGCHGVAEGAALAAAGPNGRLIVPKSKAPRSTCAAAQAPAPIDADTIGAPRGRLSVVGIGPGGAPWRTGEAEVWLREAEDIVGYKLYLDLLGPAAEGKRLHAGGMRAEEDRVRQALDLAAAGRRVALISSGDAGIYAMASLVFELLERENRADWNRVDTRVTPGVPACLAAAARIGAPLGHDFCTVSLSDLLTPWEVIEERLRAAAEADFVVAIYNPVSHGRRTQLERARDILLTRRSHETPVVLARAVGREDETVRVTTLGRLRTEDADMLTVVLVGSTETRVLETRAGPRVYTPRGYANKRRKAP